MKSAAFAYRRVNSLAAGLVQVAGETVKVMAGSQSLGPMLNLRLARPGTLIDISGMEELRVASREAASIRIGAGLTHAEIEDGVFEVIAAHPWRHIAAQIAYRGIRNRGTLGGSLAHADPAADWVLAAQTFGADIEIASRQATRRVAMRDFMTGAYSTALRSDEIIVAVILPQFDAATTRWGYYKFCRKPGEFAVASCCAVFGPDGTGCVVIGAQDGAPRALDGLAGQVARGGIAAATKEAIDEALGEAMPGKDAIERKIFVSVVRRCLEQAHGLREVA